MYTVFHDVCVLVTAAFALTLVPGFRKPERSLLSRRDQGTALLVFLVLGLVEEVTGSHSGWLNERIVAVCAAGLVAGPLAGGLLCRWRPKLAQHPLTGFCLTFGVSLLRSGLIFLSAANSRAALPRLEEIAMAPVLQGL